ncbi:zinc-dependent peptidase [Algivirga pacifica]|uniref:Zinc-dependent peptidase n=1 Tax=Algivirga pacifica TaxID=1162670 RepID=A0ABP9DJJ8_9BACT
MIYLTIFTASIFLYISLTWNRRKKTTKQKAQEVKTPEKWKKILLEKVTFYKGLNDEKRLRFESDIQNFLREIKITGVQVEVTLEDRLLVASSAVIPLFGFPEWNYTYLNEVILYPSSFDRNFTIGSKEEIITGMVGNGPMEGKMILSKPSLHLGFDISNDKRNVGIHEFVHLFDKEDGIIDGIPPGYDSRAYSLPWIDFMRVKTEQIMHNQSDIDEYATTNRQEFFAVASEYFFERPHLLKKKHPVLFKELSTIFNQDTTEVIDQDLFKKVIAPGRNDSCPCGSGQKFKRCCLN